MRHRGRFKTLGFLLLTASGLLAGPAVAAPLPDNASTSPRLKYLPKDYWLVAEGDLGMVARLLTSVNAQENPQFAQLKQYIQLVKQFTAIDLEKDVDHVTLFLTGTPDEMKMLAVVQGSFKNDLVAKRLAKTLEDSIKETTHKKHKVYDSENFSLCFPEDSTILVGDEGLVRGALDQIEAKTQDLPEALKKVLERTPGKTVVWAAVQPRVVLDHKVLTDWRAANGELHRTLKKIDSLSVFFELSDDGLLIKAMGYVAAPGGAGAVNQYLSNRKKNLLFEEGSNVLFTSLLILSEIKASGPYVEGSFRITGQAFKELWETRVIIRPEARPAEPKDK
jgi:hypothetical protein